MNALPHFCAFLLFVALPAQQPAPKHQMAPARVNCERCASLGTLTERIPRNRDEISILQAGQPAKVGPFIELAIGKLHPKTKPESLVERHVVLSRSLQKPTEWEIQAGAPWGELNLPENVFGITAVFQATATTPVEIHVNGRPFRRLQSGEVLLVLH